MAVAILLVGGFGTRLMPLTKNTPKPMLTGAGVPVTEHQLALAKAAGITEIVLATSYLSEVFIPYFGDGSQWGLNIEYCVQPSPDGLAQAFTLGKSFVGNNPSALVLGDNIFYGHDLVKQLRSADQNQQGATVFAYHVHDPERYGVVAFDEQQRAISIEEKPLQPQSNYAVTGLYFYDQQVCDVAATIKPSARGELEITDINKRYLEMGQLGVEIMGRGFAWLDTGTHESLMEAASFIAILQKRQGLMVACPEEIAFHQGWIDAARLQKLGEALAKNAYGQYLLSLLK